LQRFRYLHGKKIVVFENPQNTDVVYYAQPKKKRCFFPVFRSQTKGISIVEQCAQHQQAHEAPAPPSIKKIAGSQQKHVLPPESAFENKPIGDENSRKKKEECQGIEEHFRSFLVIRVVLNYFLSRC
jgi:hypothetical protein